MGENGYRVWSYKITDITQSEVDATGEASHYLIEIFRLKNGERQEFQH